MRKYNNVIFILFFVCVIIFIVMLCAIAGIKDNRSSAEEMAAGDSVSDRKSSDENLSDGGKHYGSNLLPNGGQDDDFVICLDAGHGGKDEGTYFGDIYEKDVTLAVVNYMNEILEDEGIHVILTRSNDTYMKLKNVQISQITRVWICL